MEKIVVVFVETRDLNLPAKEPRLAAKTNGADKSTIDTGPAQPFWTWFIENPRPQPSGSLLQPATLLFAP